MTCFHVIPPTPAEMAEILDRAHRRHCTHEAGHAVAAVARGGVVQQIFIAPQDSDIDKGFVRHLSTPKNQPFTTFAGVWAEARFEADQDAELSVHEALDLAWDSNVDGDGARYGDLVAQLDDLAEELGLIGYGGIARAWETDWEEELAELWPAIVAVADQLVDGVPVGHIEVHAAIAALNLEDL